MHIPVLLEEVKQNCQLGRKATSYLDCTFGRGGHFAAIKQIYPDLITDAIDQDMDAIHYAKEKFASLAYNSEFAIHHCNFMDDTTWPKQNFLNDKFDLILADLGVSSPQLDEAERGFSFYNDGPLDMRMDQTKGESAADIVNTYEQEDLIQLFKDYGEIRQPMKAVKAILKAREETKFTRTLELAELIEKSDGWRKKNSHPATKYFLAIRLKVNNELAPLDKALDNLLNCLRSGGRLLVISFHSSEDRIVKWNFKKNKKLGKIITKKVIMPERCEALENPRARSAKLRVFEKGSEQ